jgi:sugar-specific transcriptional regulator TrmB
MLKEELQKFGLTDKEAKVYLAALELGPAPVQKIAFKSKVNRATTYVVIESLTEMGLMSTFDQGKKTYFVAERPERLLSFLKSQEIALHDKIKALKAQMPELLSIFNATTDKPKVKYYEGVEGLKTVQNDFIESSKEGDEIFIFLPYDEYMKMEPLLSMEKYREKRIPKKISSKIIYTSRKGRQSDYEKKGNSLMIETKYIEYDKYPFSGGMNIYGNKIFYIDYTGKPGGVVVENQTLAEMQKAMFNLAWEALN